MNCVLYMFGGCFKLEA